MHARDKMKLKAGLSKGLKPDGVAAIGSTESQEAFAMYGGKARAAEVNFVGSSIAHDDEQVTIHGLREELADGLETKLILLRCVKEKTSRSDFVRDLATQKTLMLSNCYCGLEAQH
ncbi:hypothetical protein SVAN01_04691 [Stagonosporopsis vannaccii]|nr:hypothetical protein SVAN01_04691 [Stagonosporopsis vannaccii]